MKNNLKSYRKIYKLTQKELAEQLDLTREHIQRIEKGSHIPNLDTAFKISNYFNVTIEEIFIYNKGE